MTRRAGGQATVEVLGALPALLLLGLVALQLLAVGYSAVLAGAAAEAGALALAGGGDARAGGAPVPPGLVAGGRERVRRRAGRCVCAFVRRRRCGPSRRKLAVSASASVGGR